ncbi:MAG: hypothetical protein KDA58_11935 [Planctomycetaceae bacterium]|nr:hypothetical protein [Planctomycetaceae bacterium]
MSRSDLRQYLFATRIDPNEIRDRQQKIYAGLQTHSPYLADRRFLLLEEDLAWLFDQYDTAFFAGQCRGCLGGTPLEFRVSSRMTSAGAKTSRHRNPHTGQDLKYEIAVALTLLRQTFQTEVDREIKVTGLVCHDRIEALQRVFEHELIHLIEMLVWDVSNCSAERFQALALQFFGHTGHQHTLVTPREVFRLQGMRPGTMVRFTFEGRTHVGRINRITKRASVLVEDPEGVPYSDGRNYTKYYIPLNMLEPVT